MEESKKKTEIKQIDSKEEIPTAAPATAAEARETKLPKASSSAPEDLDAFLLGDLGSDDDGLGEHFIHVFGINTFTISYKLPVVRLIFD